MNDSDIIAMFFERNEGAIKATDEKYGSYLRKIAYNILFDIHYSDECCIDTYFKAWNKIPPDHPRIFSAFLAKITRNIAIDKWRALCSAKRGGNVTESFDELAECIGEESTVFDLEARELGEIISAFLKTQKSTSRKIFVRRYFFGESVSDIASSMNISKSNIKTSLSRTRTKLSLYLKEFGVNI